ncbi:MAG: SAM-dependent methyltransferase [Alistipes sp.]|nr:SAM-dependent methyltransferase [Alistipes sp.]MBR7097075.1 SAM-dependent methyltransferase [Alistipes sp.]
MAEKGILYMIPCPISDSTEVFDVLPEANRRIMDSLDYFIVENVRSARRFLSKARVSRRIEDLEFVELNEHTIAGAAVEAMVKPIEAGRSAGVISEAGVPGVADPGALVVEACHRRDIKVVPLVGPSSILLAMMASGLNGQSFAFVGYLPVKPPERAKALKSLERRAHVEQQSQIFIEAPYRNVKLAEQILAVCGADTRLTIACDITSPEQIIVTRSVAQWRKCGLPDIAKRPTIFIIG